MNSKEKTFDQRYLGGVLVLFVGIMLLILVVAVVEIRSCMRKAAEQSNNQKIADIITEQKYRLPDIITKTGQCIGELEKANEKLAAENDDLKEASTTLEKDSSVTSAADSLESRVLPHVWTPENELLRLFDEESVDESVSGGGAYIADSSDSLSDTMVYMAYKPKAIYSGTWTSADGFEWEQYNRIEVDMFKRNGTWTSDSLMSVTVTLPETLEKSEYWISIYLRNDASELKREEASDDVYSVNGGTVSVSVGGKKISSGELRFNKKPKSDVQIIECAGGDELILAVSPQDNTSFFSYAVCIKKK